MEFELKVRPEVLGSRLKAARSVRRMTQEAAAQALGVARTTVVAIEAGKRLVTLSELRTLAALYGVSEADLLDERSEPIELQVQFLSLIHI